MIGDLTPSPGPRFPSLGARGLVEPRHRHRGDEPKRTPLIVTADGRRPTVGIPLHAGAMSVAGNVRTRNEDAYLVASLAASGARLGPYPEVVRPDDRGLALGRDAVLAAVADGLGGHARGDIASALALEHCDARLRSELGLCRPARLDRDRLERTLDEAVRAAHQAVLDAAQRHPDRQGMGTTLTAALVRWPWLHVAHVGDSRGYLLRRGSLHQLTSDHTLAQELRDRGVLDEEGARTSRFRHQLTNAIGAHRDELRVDLHRLELEPGDRLLLCTDGLSSELDPHQIEMAMTTRVEPAAACSRLVQLALDAGGRDNVTAVILNAAIAGAPAPETFPG